MDPKHENDWTWKALNLLRAFVTQAELNGLTDVDLAQARAVLDEGIAAKNLEELEEEDRKSRYF